MADKIELVSFDVDTATATKQVDSYIATLNKLELELRELQKQGKDTTAVQNKIAQATAQLNKALTAETTTLKGAVSQTAAYNKAQKELDSTTKKTIATTNNLSAATQKQAAGFARSLAGAKNLTQTFTRGAAGLSNLVGGFGIASVGINLLSDGVAKLANEYFKASLAEESVDNASKAYAETVAKETATLKVNFGALNNTNLSLSQRKEALDNLIQQFPEYFGGLDAEKATVQELQLAYEATTIAIKQKAIQTALAAEREKIVSKQVSAQIEFETKQLAFRNRLLEQGRTEAEAEAILSRNRLSGASVVVNTYLDIVSETAKAETALNELEKKLTSDITEREKEKVKAAKEATEARIKDEKAQTAAAEKASSRRKKEADEREKARQAIKDEDAENQRLKGTLAGLQKELSKVNELLNSGVKIEDKERLAELGAEYQRITKEIESAQAAIDAVTKARKADEVQIIKNAKIGNVQNALLEVEISQNQKLAETLEVQRQRELNLIEVNRQKNLAATQNETARNVINAAAAKERERVEAESAANILKIRLKTQQQKLQLAEREKQDTTEISKEILSLEADLLKLTGKQYDIKVGFDDKSGEDTEGRIRKLIGKIADVVQEFSGQVFDFLSSQNQAAIAQADAAISKQQELLNGLLANEQQVNVEQVRLEQERLDKLNKAREKAAENEARIAQAQIAINLALAVARAVAEGGGLASAITVGLALSAAIFGFLKAKQTASQAFYEGTMYAERAPHEPAGRDTINARLNEGEAIIPTDTTKKYNKSLEAIYYGKIPAADMNKMVGDYLSGAKAVRSLADNAAQGNKQQFQIVALASAERKTAKAANYSGSPKDYDIRLFAELVTAEIRKLPKSQVKAGDLAKVIQSRADNKGKIRKRLGLK